jgi:uncharacterized protein YyaL (SSP411 family)
MLREPQWLEPARKIRGYLQSFLASPEGAFYTSQDADLVPGEHSGDYFALDDAARRKLGIPKVDQHCYARENGLAIVGLAKLYAATGDSRYLAEARRAAEWIVARRALPTVVSVMMKRTARVRISPTLWRWPGVSRTLHRHGGTFVARPGGSWRRIH